MRSRTTNGAVHPRVLQAPILTAWRRNIFAIFCATVLVTSVSHAAQGAKLWMSVLEPQWRRVLGWPAADFDDLFVPNAQWRAVAGSISVLNLSLRFVLTAPDQELQLVLAGLKSRKIELSIQAQPLTETEQCGIATESFGPPDEMAAAAKRLKEFGADLRYVVMDEPFYFGHEFPGTPQQIPCHYSLEQLGEQAAHKMAPLLEAFPCVVVGDIEPFGAGGSMSADTWAQQIILWHQQFRLKSRVAVRFLDADIIWETPGSAEQVAKALPTLKAHGLSTGVIYHGFPSAKSNDEWYRQALGEIQSFENHLGASPDRVSIESWNDFPRNLLPETQEATLTNLILVYLKDRKSRGQPISRKISVR
jgi:hypothetical protein